MTERNGVTVVGSVHMDMIASAREMPSPGSSVIGGQFVQAPGGKAGNLATQLARLGVRTWLIAKVGDDAMGDAISTSLAMAGVNLEFLWRSTGGTTGASTSFAVAGEYASIIVPGVAGTMTAEDIDRAVMAFSQSRYVISQLELPIELALAVFRHGHANGAVTILNASPLVGWDRSRLHALLDQTDVLVVNQHEGALLVDMPIEHRAAAAAAGSTLCKRHSLQTAIVTCGAAGASLSRGEVVIEQASWDVEVQDAVGAGDAFLGGLVAAWIDGLDDSEALKIATAAGALATTGAGASTSLPDWSAIRSFLQGRT